MQQIYITEKSLQFKFELSRGEKMEYKFAKYLSSHEFYKDIGRLNRGIELYRPNKIVLDFSDTIRIDALVIPNLIILGRDIRRKTSYIPFIRLGENLNAGYIKKYLFGINFYKISDEFYYYENDRYSGLEGKKMDPRNTTEYFSKSEGTDVARRRIYYKLCPFFYKYLNQFSLNKYNSIFLDSYIFENNIISQFIEEMILNSFDHGNSDAVITVQANYKKEKLYLAISDYGKGFWNSVCSCQESNGYNVLGRLPQNELEGIYVGIYKRKYSKIYGIYNVIRQVIKMHGIFRIHSNDTQVIITERLEEKFDNEGLITLSSDNNPNVIQTAKFPGTHIEIELPFSTRN